MASYSVKGIVVGRTDFGEADRVIRLLTPDRGKISAVAKGVRKIKSRSGGHLELFGEVNLMLAEGRNLDIITSARLAWYPHHLTSDYEGLELAFMMATMIDRLMQDGQPNQRAYEALRDGLGALEGNDHGRVLELWYKLQIVNALGLSPVLNGCVNCGRRDGTAHYWFSIEKGGILDESCHDVLDPPISNSTVKLWRLLIAAPYATAQATIGADDISKESLPICDEFYIYHLGRRFTPNYSNL